MNVQASSSQTANQISGDVARAKFTNVGESTRSTTIAPATTTTPNFYYNGITEYNLAKYGWNVYIDTNCAATKQAATLYCTCYGASAAGATQTAACL